MTQITINVFPDSLALGKFAADLFGQIVRGAVISRGKFLCALSGGSTPMALYRLLAASPFRESLPWEKMYFFWGDERCVPPDNPESNYYQAHQAWLSLVAVPEKNIFRARGELDPQSAAKDYMNRLEKFAGANLSWPRFDLALMGLGDDGHTASLFPGSAETSGIAVVAVSADYQDRPANRVSLTPDVFNSARNVVFLAAGAAKANAVADTLVGSRNPNRLPAQRISPMDGKLWWLLDVEAASHLPESIAGISIQR